MSYTLIQMHKVGYMNCQGNSFSSFKGVSVNTQLQCLNAYCVPSIPLPCAPAHFYVLCGILLKCPLEPRSKSIVTTTASRVAVLSIPECVVGEPHPGSCRRPRKWVAVLVHHCLGKQVKAVSQWSINHGPCMQECRTL